MRQDLKRMRGSEFRTMSEIIYRERTDSQRYLNRQEIKSDFNNHQHCFENMSDSISMATTLVDTHFAKADVSKNIFEEPALVMTQMKKRGTYV